jgi:hypothetical protein
MSALVAAARDWDAVTPASDAEWRAHLDETAPLVTDLA